ncbi:hypothetical protein CQA53_01720 [Helicobacter didelphidarum]|uniref:DUF2972 domain-containing protein n=1 Tax=Helicobacter didelphidarum TaxID=2040648 RepID=A0A3D8IP19_9HELI|nr:DUF2972 domain-containing protein [Helicobacter didelphidarum]RDU67008.1 hypothetical protein CQA53_01720 [Helicobacter didelphidarum]
MLTKIKKSKGMRIFWEQGFCKGIKYHINRGIKSVNKRMYHIKIYRNIINHLFPFLILNRKDYETFLLLRMKFKENYENIIYTDLFFFMKNLNAHIAWVTSDKFQQEYGDFLSLCSQENINSPVNTIHFTPPPPIISQNKNVDSKTQDSLDSYLLNQNIAPYPPLLNPKEIDYERINPEIAWEINLPLKDEYLFYFRSQAVSAHDAVLDMFRSCGIESAMHHNFSIKDFFVQNFKLIQNKDIASQNKLVFYILYHNLLSVDKIQNVQKFFSLTYHKHKKVIYLVRDPIARMRSLINDSWSKGLLKISLECSIIEALKDGIKYGGWGREFNFMSKIDNLGFPHYAMDSLVQMMDYNANIHYLDFEEILPKNAFSTFEKLSKKFHFDPPCHETFPNSVKHDTQLKKILPIELVVNEKIKILIYTTYYQDDQINITNLLLENCEYENLGCFVENESIYETIINNKELLIQLKEYFKVFMQHFKKKVEIEKDRDINERDILQYLQQNPDTRKKVKEMYDKELVHIKTHRPDIVASWKYYQEFEKICTEEGIG